MLQLLTEDMAEQMRMGFGTGDAGGHGGGADIQQFVTNDSFFRNAMVCSSLSAQRVSIILRQQILARQRKVLIEA